MTDKLITSFNQSVGPSNGSIINSIKDGELIISDDIFYNIDHKLSFKKYDNESEFNDLHCELKESFNYVMSGKRVSIEELRFVVSMFNKDFFEQPKPESRISNPLFVKAYDGVQIDIYNHFTGIDWDSGIDLYYPDSGLLMINNLSYIELSKLSGDYYEREVNYLFKKMNDILLTLTIDNIPKNQVLLAIKYLSLVRQ